MRSGTWLGSLLLATLLVSACGPILGVDAIHVDEQLTLPDGGVVLVPSGVACKFPQDCPALDTEPAACAEVTCVGGNCLYKAKDEDQDGHPAAKCRSKNGIAITPGDDCDDKDSQLFPGHDKPCAEAEDGTALSFPTATPVGDCKLGTKSCNPDGTVSACKGAVGPQAVTTCTPEKDEACTGNPSEKCPCTPGTSQPCGGPAVGNCKVGSAACDTNGVLGACVGSVAPAARDCGSANDMDCNGAADNAEAGCQCPGGGGPGATRGCNGHAQDGVGACHAGSQTCVAAGPSANWTGCAGDVGPSAEICDGVDRDCNGLAGVDEAAPPSPPGTMNCTHVFACPAPGRGPLYYREGVGFTNYAGTGTLWTAYASRGVFSAGTYPPGTVRISRDASTATKMGPYGVATACCPSGCPGSGIFYDGEGQFYTAP